MLKVSQLTGFNVGGENNIAFVASATSADSGAVTAPADIRSGDLIVLYDRATRSTALPTTAIPSGFTSIINSTQSDVIFIRAICSYKMADGSEDSASLSGMTNGDLGMSKILLVFRKPNTILITPADAAGQVTSANPTAQTVNASGGVAPLVVFGAYGTGGSVIDPRTFTPAKDEEVPVTDSKGIQYFAYKIYNSTPQDTSVDMDDEGDFNTLQSFYIEMA